MPCSAWPGRLQANSIGGLAEGPDEFLRLARLQRDDVRILVPHVGHRAHHRPVLLLLLRLGEMVEKDQ
jgi:hypothetical protein